MNESAPYDFDQFDKLDLKPFSERLEKYLMVDHEFVDGSLVVSLNSRFGSGKTTFLRMWENDLIKRRETDKSLPKCIILNAWENDYCGDPLLSIITGLLSLIDSNNSRSNKKKSIRDAAKDVAWFVTGLANSFISSNIGVDVLAAADFTDNKKNIPDYISLYEQRTESLNTLKKELSNVFSGNQVSAIVFVDELDRCRPDFAIHYLETIKHIFDIPGLVFILAVDYIQLRYSVESLFGTDTNVEEYLRKFVHRQFKLPTPEKASSRELYDAYIDIYLRDNGKRKCLSLFGQDNILCLVNLAISMKLTPRQTQELFRTVAHVIGGDLPETTKKLDAFIEALILLVLLRIAKPELYTAIGEGRNCNLEIGQFLIQFLDKDDALFWLNLYLVGIGYRTSDTVEYVKLMRDLNINLEEGKNEAASDLSAFVRRWGHRSNFHTENRMQHIQRRIESAMIL